MRIVASIDSRTLTRSESKSPSSSSASASNDSMSIRFCDSQSPVTSLATTDLPPPPRLPLLPAARTNWLSNSALRSFCWRRSCTAIRSALQIATGRIGRAAGLQLSFGGGQAAWPAPRIRPAAERLPRHCRWPSRFGSPRAPDRSSDTDESRSTVRSADPARGSARPPPCGALRSSSARLLSTFPNSGEPLASSRSWSCEISSSSCSSEPAASFNCRSSSSVALTSDSSSSRRFDVGQVRLVLHTKFAGDAGRWFLVSDSNATSRISLERNLRSARLPTAGARVNSAWQALAASWATASRRPALAVARPGRRRAACAALRSERPGGPTAAWRLGGNSGCPFVGRQAIQVGLELLVIGLRASGDRRRAAGDRGRPGLSRFQLRPSRRAKARSAASCCCPRTRPDFFLVQLLASQIEHRHPFVQLVALVGQQIGLGGQSTPIGLDVAPARSAPSVPRPATSKNASRRAGPRSAPAGRSPRPPRGGPGRPSARPGVPPRPPTARRPAARHRPTTRWPGPRRFRFEVGDQGLLRSNSSRRASQSSAGEAVRRGQPNRSRGGRRPCSRWPASSSSRPHAQRRTRVASPLLIAMHLAHAMLIETYTTHFRPGQIGRSEWANRAAGVVFPARARAIGTPGVSGPPAKDQTESAPRRLKRWSPPHRWVAQP